MNVAIVGYLVWTKRLFGVHGGATAAHDDTDWDESSGPGFVGSRRGRDTVGPSRPVPSPCWTQAFVESPVDLVERLGVARLPSEELGERLRPGDDDIVELEVLGEQTDGDADEAQRTAHPDLGVFGLGEEAPNRVDLRAHTVKEVRAVPAVDERRGSLENQPPLSLSSSSP